MDFVVEKGSELGVEAFLPFYCERSVGRDVGAEKAARWQRIARASAQQCGRKSVPAVLEPMPYRTLLERFGEYDAVLFAWELATPAPLTRRLAEALPASGRVLVVVGPEGGFTHEEAELAQAPRGRNALARPARFTHGHGRSRTVGGDWRRGVVKTPARHGTSLFNRHPYLQRGRRHRKAAPSAGGDLRRERTRWRGHRR